MNPQEREQLRISLLRHLSRGRGLKRFGISTPLLLQLLRSEGMAWPDEETVEAELGYLTELKYVVVPEKVISPENRTWRLTAEGRNYVAERGLE
jgi:hypothetical protein